MAAAQWPFNGLIIPGQPDLLNFGLLPRPPKGYHFETFQNILNTYPRKSYKIKYGLSNIIRNNNNNNNKRGKSSSPKRSSGSNKKPKKKKKSKDQSPEDLPFSEPPEDPTGNPPANPSDNPPTAAPPPDPETN
ncbi:Uncharacterized protein FWK35_00004310 [Aphis craccivora]|uniref:Uncharacterized protein n=1 Tax=Aphis craccivora TaxID=307492 RepID=A0A6G0ZBS9_APHCR|nr:Uncharacterized protein FWK35_00004310 [Aphis craccivora]